MGGTDAQPSSTGRGQRPAVKTADSRWGSQHPRGSLAAATLVAWRQRKHRKNPHKTTGCRATEKGARPPPRHVPLTDCAASARQANPPRRPASASPPPAGRRGQPAERRRRVDTDERASLPPPNRHVGRQQRRRRAPHPCAHLPSRWRPPFPPRCGAQKTGGGGCGGEVRWLLWVWGGEGAAMGGMGCVGERGDHDQSWSLECQQPGQFSILDLVTRGCRELAWRRARWDLFCKPTRDHRTGDAPIQSMCRAGETGVATRESACSRGGWHSPFDPPLSVGCLPECPRAGGRAVAARLGPAPPPRPATPP